MTDRWNRRDFLRSVGILAIVPVWLRSGRALAEEPSSPLKILDAEPFNAEPYLDRLVSNWITPVDTFYVRSNAPTPKLDPEAFRLSVEGMVDLPLSLSLAEMRDRFPRVETTCTLTCAGNRRTELMAIKPIKGVAWGAGAIGNATWKGFRLSSLLKLAGVKAGASHVWFEGLDQVKQGEETIPFGASIPLEKALSDTETIPGALVCDRMNGEPLTPEHGSPLRIVVPGFIGARSVKWVGRIIVSNRPSTNPFVAESYKLIYENTPEEIAKAPPLMNNQITSVIADPGQAAKVPAGPLHVRGYALPPGKPGVTIRKVELSADGGKTWIEAGLTSEPKEFCWQLWEAEIAAMPPNATLVARATDSENQIQPETIPWNHKGYMNNAWHKVTVDVGS